jgi:CRP-like cAMP-binding protein
VAAKRGGCTIERWCSSKGMAASQSAGFSAGWRANRYGRGNVLFYQGNEPFALFFLCSGRVKIVRHDREGRRQIVRIIRAPDFIGERSLIARQPYHATAEVMDDADICVIDSARFFKFWGERPDFARVLAQRLAINLGDAQDLASELALHTIRERLAKFLALEWEAVPKPAPSFQLSESRQELAEIIGTSPEVVSRTLRDLVDGKIIAIEGRRVRVLDGARLRAAARLPRESLPVGGGGTKARTPGGEPPLDFYQARAKQPSSSVRLRPTHNRQADA